jgi:deoxyribose-phosphate aldolase
MKTEELAKYIDHTILKADAKPQDIEKLCLEAAENKFAAVCVNPVFVAEAARFLADTDVGIATVIGFPLGANTTSIKVRETIEAIEAGATEIDMVIPVGLMKAGRFGDVEEDIHAVVKAAGSHIVKVIIETCYLTGDEIRKVSQICVDAGAAYVKTSTGFGPRGASVEDVTIIKSIVGGRCKIKASGGIKTYEQALAMIQAGASRIGTSSGVTIVKGGNQ